MPQNLKKQLNIPVIKNRLDGSERTRPILILSADYSRFKKVRHETFGKFIKQAREAKKLTLTNAAALILKPDKTQISVQYLSDIEKARRNPPPEYLLIQFSEVLEIPIELLYFYAEIFPSNLNFDADQKVIIDAMRRLLSLKSNDK